jgi:hypothetical protein
MPDPTGADHGRERVVDAGGGRVRDPLGGRAQRQGDQPELGARPRGAVDGAGRARDRRGRRRRRGGRRGGDERRLPRPEPEPVGEPEPGCRSSRGCRRGRAPAACVQPRDLGRPRRPWNRDLERSAEGGRGGGRGTGRTPRPDGAPGPGGPTARLCTDAGARRRLALRPRPGRSRQGGGLAGPALPSDCGEGRHRRRDGRRLRRRYPVRSLLRRPPGRGNGGDADRRTRPSKPLRRLARSLPRLEAVLRGQDRCACDGGRRLREDQLPAPASAASKPPLRSLGRLRRAYAGVLASHSPIAPRERMPLR